jgi:hypothetical protein
MGDTMKPQPIFLTLTAGGILWLLALAFISLTCSGCASQTKHEYADGRKTYHTAEVLHDSDFSAQWDGSGSYIRTTISKDGIVTTDSITTTNAIASVRSKPQGTKAMSLWGQLKLWSQGLGVLSDVGQDAVETIE